MKISELADQVRNIPLREVLERRAFGLGLETIPFQHFTERNVAHLVGEYGDFHPLIGHPIERRTSLKVALTSSGEGQSDNAAGSPNSSSLEAFSFAGGVRGEAELGLVPDEFRVKLFRPVVIVALGCYCDFRPQFGNTVFEDEFRCVRQGLWGRRRRGMHS